MAKFYSFSFVTNIILSVLFILVDFYAIFQDSRLSDKPIGFFIYFLCVYIFFLLLDFLCFKLKKSNTLLIVFNNIQRKWGTAVTIITIILAVSLVIVTCAAFTIFGNFASLQQMRFQPVYICFLSIILVSAITTLFNAWYYFKAIKQNKIIVNMVINDIGH